jgi:hypothetical protein
VTATVHIPHCPNCDIEDAGWKFFGPDVTELIARLRCHKCDQPMVAKRISTAGGDA